MDLRRDLGTLARFISEKPEHGSAFGVLSAGISGIVPVIPLEIVDTAEVEDQAARVPGAFDFTPSWALNYMDVTYSPDVLLLEAAAR